MHTALTRTRPTRRSCVLRLALADWLHRRLRRGGLPINEHQPAWLLHHHRRQVALLRSRLRVQLTESEPAAAETVKESEQLRLLRRLLKRAQRLSDEHDAAEARMSLKLSWLMKERAEQAGRRLQLSATERSMTVVRVARLDGDYRLQLQQLAGLERRLRLLKEQSVNIQRASDASEEEDTAEVDALAVRVLGMCTEDGDRYWLFRAGLQNKLAELGNSTDGRWHRGYCCIM